MTKAGFYHLDEEQLAQLDYLLLFWAKAVRLEKNKPDPFVQEIAERHGTALMALIKSPEHRLTHLSHEAIDCSMHCFEGLSYLGTPVPFPVLGGVPFDRDCKALKRIPKFKIAP